MSNNLESVEKLKKHGCGGNFRMYQIIGNDLIENMSNQELADFEERQEQIQVSPEDFSALVDKYKKRSQLNEATKMIVKFNNGMVKTAISLMKFTSPMGVMLGTAGEYLAGKALNQVYNAIEERLDASTSHLLAYGLQKTKEKDDQAFEKLRQMSPKEAMEFIYDKSPDFSKIMDQVSEKNRSIVTHAMLEDFKRRQTEKELDQLMTDQIQDDHIQQHRDAIIETTSRIDSLADRSARHFNTLYSSQQEINQELEQINLRVKSNTGNILKNQRDINFMKEYLYAKMTPDEKIKAIEKGLITLPDGERKEEELERLRLLKKQKAFVNASSHYLETSKQVLGIAQNLGLEGKELDFANDAITYGSTIRDAIVGFSSGNYISAVASVTRLFGRKKKRVDPTLAHIQRLSKMMQTVLKNQVYVDRKLNRIIKNLDKLILGQQLILEKLSDLAHKIDNNYNDLSFKLYNLHGDVLYNRELINELLVVQDIRTLEDWMKTEYSTFLVNVEESKFPTHGEMNAFYRNKHRTWVSKELLFNQLYDVGDLQYFTIPVQFRLDTYKRAPQDSPFQNELTKNNDEINSEIEFYKDYLLKALNHLLIASGERKDQILGSLLIATESFDTLDLKYQGKIELTESELLNARLLIRPNNAFFIETSILERVTRVLLGFNNVFPFADNQLRLLSLEEIASSQKLERNDLQNTKDALFLINLAVAQQVLKAGDVLIPLMYSHFDRGLEKEKYEDNEIAMLLAEIAEKNEFIRSNFLHYFLLKRIEKTGHSIAAYTLAYRNPKQRLLSHVLQTTTLPQLEYRYYPMDIVKDSDQQEVWKVMLFGHETIMPDGEQLLDNKISYPQDVYSLLQLKAQVLSELAIFEPDSVEDPELYEVLSLAIGA